MEINARALWLPDRSYFGLSSVIQAIADQGILLAYGSAEE